MAAKITIVGNVTRDPETKIIGTQNACVFTVAVRTRAKAADGSYKSNFYDCTFFGKMGEYFMSRAQKGTGVTVIGDLAVDAYTTSGGEVRPALRVTVDTAECMSRIKEAGAAPARAAATSEGDEIPF